MSKDDQVIIASESLDDGQYLALSGDIDLSRSPAMRQELLHLAEKGWQRLVIDLSDVSYMDSSGVATLVEALQQQRKHGGRMILCGLQERVRSIFEIARLDMVFTIVDSKREAMDA
jgi:anti-sigma B factor antagonist